eukprot:NODE_70_length_24940_cov_0.663138.p21 type:complete len:131 gc:universal NODE_70_length_24940_cov_0.663138:10220-9828(-)
MNWVDAILSNNTDQIKQLIDDDKIEEMIDYQGMDYTPLSLCSKIGSLESAKLLISYHASIKHWAQINHQNHLGWTPLMFAVQNQHFEIVLYLLEHEADLMILNSENQSALDISSGEMRELLEFKMKEINK